MSNSTFGAAFVGAVLAAAAAASAGVIASTDSNITTWGTTPITRTYLTPDVPITAASNVGENFNGNRIVAQTFRVSTTSIFDKVKLLVSGGAATYSVHLFNVTGGSSLGGSYKPSTDGPVGLKGVDLLPTAPTFTFNGVAANTTTLLTLDFDGLDEALLPSLSLDSTSTLVASQYALELWPTSNTTTSMNWIRGGGGISTYSNGDGYEVNNTSSGGASPSTTTLRSQLAGSSRDLVLGVFPEPTSLAALGAAGICGMIRRRRA